jgi:hypothetical protein
MPTHHDETLHDRYAREHASELAIMAKMTPEEVYALSLELHNAKAERDAVHAEAEALRKGLRDPEAVLVGMLRGDIAKLSARGIAKAYGEVLNGEDAQHVEIARLRSEVEALRAENERLLRSAQTNWNEFADGVGETARLRTELEAARVLLRKWLDADLGVSSPAINRLKCSTDYLLATTPAPEVRPTVKDPLTVQAGHGERQDAVAWSLRLPDGRTTLEKAYPKWAEGEGDGYAIQPLYTTQQPGPDVRALVEALRTVVGLMQHKADTPLEQEAVRMADAALSTYRQARGGSD